MGQLMLQGIPPYEMAYNMKLPGIYAIYALFQAVFGQTTEAIHLGLLLTNLAACILIFALHKKIIGGSWAFISAATYGILSLSPYVLGFAGHATQFIVPFVLGGFLLLLHALEKPHGLRLLGAGILFALAVLMKQSALPFCFWACAVIALTRENSMNCASLKIRSLLFFVLGVLVPILAVFAALFFLGVFDRFWFWIFTYMRTYASQVQFKEALHFFWIGLTYSSQKFIGLWFLALCGIAITGIFSALKRPRWLILSFFFFSFLSICPGLYFRNHYFVTLLPALALGAGIFFQFISTELRVKKTWATLLFFTLISTGVAAQPDYFFWEHPINLAQKIYRANPIRDSVAIGKLLRALTRPEEKIAVLGSEPQIYFYAKRHSATGYIYMYPLMENQKYSLAMQEDMIREIETSNPSFIVFVVCKESWGFTSKSNLYIYEWWNNLLSTGRYIKFGSVDIYENQAIYRFRKDRSKSEARSTSQIHIYKRAN